MRSNAVFVYSVACGVKLSKHSGGLRLINLLISESHLKITVQQLQ